MKRKILITGVNGFLGHSLIGYLEKNYKKDYQVIGLARRRLDKSRNILICDLTQEESILRIIKKIRPEWIFHLVGDAQGNVRQLYQANILTTKNLLESIRSVKDYCPRVIIPGTAAEYGPMRKGQTCLKETDALRPKSAYGKSKAKQVQLALSYERFGIQIVIARIFNVIGKDTPLFLALGNFAKQIVDIESARQAPIIQTGYLQGQRDFLDIEDVCSALLKLVQNGKAGQVYNVCSNQKVTIKSLLNKMLKSSKVKGIKIKEFQTKRSFSFDSVGSNLRIRRELKWIPKVSLEKGLQNTLKSYRLERKERG